MSIASILGPDGAIARRLPHYEARPQQLDMAEAVADAIAERQQLMVEAGTGVGKSFAYLVPAILAATADKDLPRRHLHAHHQPARTTGPQGHPVPAERHAAAVQRHAGQGPLQLPQPAPAARGASSVSAALLGRALATDEQLQQIGHWSRQTQDGSRSDLSFQPLPGRLGPGRERQRQLPGPGLPRLRQCFYFKARKQMFGGQPAGRQSRPVLQRPGPAPRGRQPAAGLQGRHLRRGPHPGGRRRRPPGPARSAAAPSSICSTSCTTRAASAACSPARRRGRPAQVEDRPQRRRALLRRHPRLDACRQPRTGSRPQCHPTSVRRRARPRAGIVPDILSEELKKLASRVDASSPRTSTTNSKIEFTSVAGARLRLAGRHPAMAGPGAAGPGLLDRRVRGPARRAWSWPAPRSRSARPCTSSSTARCRP